MTDNVGLLAKLLVLCLKEVILQGELPCLERVQRFQIVDLNYFAFKNLLEFSPLDYHIFIANNRYLPLGDLQTFKGLAHCIIDVTLKVRY